MRLAGKENFRMIGTTDYKIDAVDVETIPWRSETEVADLRPVDIGIMLGEAGRAIVEAEYPCPCMPPGFTRFSNPRSNSPGVPRR